MRQSGFTASEQSEPAICGPDGELRPEDVIERIHAYYDCGRAEPIPKEYV